jgi:hypothetical protein
MPLSAAEAGWRDRFIVDDGWYGVPYPPAYVRGRPVIIYPDRWSGPVIYPRRGRTVYVEPDAYYGAPLYGDLEVLPEDRMIERRVIRPAKPRAQERAAARTNPPADEEAPAVVPGLAPAKPPGRGKVVAVEPAALAPPARPAQTSPPQSRIAAAAVAMPVPRPNLEGMDFASEKPAAPPVIPPAGASDEGRR